MIDDALWVGNLVVEPPSAMKRILLVDDDQQLATALQWILADESFMVDVAHDGQEALVAGVDDHTDGELIDDGRRKRRFGHRALRVDDDVPSRGYFLPVAPHDFPQATPDTIAHHRAAECFLDADAKAALRQAGQVELKAQGNAVAIHAQAGRRKGLADGDRVWIETDSQVEVE